MVNNSVGIWYLGANYNQTGLLNAPYGTLIMQPSTGFTTGNDTYFEARSGQPDSIRQPNQTLIGYIPLGKMQTIAGDDVSDAQKNTNKTVNVFVAQHSTTSVPWLKFWEQGAETAIVNAAKRMFAAGYDGVFLDDVFAYRDMATVKDYANNSALLIALQSFGSPTNWVSTLASAMADLIINVRLQLTADGYGAKKIYLGHAPDLLDHLPADPTNAKRVALLNAIDAVLYESTNGSISEVELADAVFDYQGKRVIAVEAHSASDRDAVNAFYSKAVAAGAEPYSDQRPNNTGTHFSNVAVNLFNFATDDANVLTAIGSTERRGMGGDDQIWGDDTNNRILGDQGNDVLRGRGGNDTLDGGSGNDSIDGGEGDDWVIYDAADTAANVTGGGGTDTLLVRGGSAPTGFNLAAQGFEAARHEMTDTTNQSWSTITDHYNASWQRSLSNIAFDNGTRQDRVFDWQANQSYSEYVNDYGDTAFSSSVTRQIIIADAGTREERFFDYRSNQSYSEYINSYLDLTLPGAVTRQVILGDAGTKQERFFDYRSNQSYVEYINDYADAARPNSVTRQVTFFDNGTKQERFFDYLNNQPAYSEYINFYNAAGQVTRQVGFNNAGAQAWEYFY